MKYISLHGAYYPNNFGDVLILAIQAKWISEATGGKVLLPFATQIYRDTIGSDPIYGAEAIKKSDYLVYGAGGYLGEPPHKNLRWDYNFLKNHVKAAKIASRYSIPYIINGTGAGPISNPILRKEILKIARNAKQIVVRDYESKNFFKKIDPTLNVESSADVALSLRKEDIDHKYKDYIQKEFLNFEGPKIGIHVGANFKDSQHGSNVKMMMNEIIEFFNLQPDLVPTIIIDNDNQVQREATNYLKERLKRNPIIYIHHNIWETVALLSMLDTVVTNKLHVGIVNYALGNIPISFPSHTKTSRFYRQIDLESYCIPIVELRKGQTIKVLAEVLHDIKTDNKEKYQVRREEMYELAMLNKTLLEAALD